MDGTSLASTFSMIAPCHCAVQMLDSSQTSTLTTRIGRCSLVDPSSHRRSRSYSPTKSPSFWSWEFEKCHVPSSYCDPCKPLRVALSVESTLGPATSSLDLPSYSRQQTWLISNRMDAFPHTWLCLVCRVCLVTISTKTFPTAPKKK